MWKEVVVTYLKVLLRILLDVLREITIKLLGFQVLRAVVMKSSIFWDITPCSPLKDNLRFGGTCRLQLLEKLIIRPWRRHVPPKSRLTFNGLQRRYIPKRRSILE
jgi:hypothetical protein